MASTLSFIILVISCIGLLSAFENDTTAYSDDDGQRSSKILSRRKRYLTFPDGSSFQLVFCTQNSGYLQIGDIVWFGTTAALAWVLPTDPELFNIFKEQKKDFPSNRRADVKNHIYYLDENGKIISKVPYKRKLIVNPAFAKRSVDNVQTTSANATQVFKKEMHDPLKTDDFFKRWNSNDIDFHRVGRKSLYVKLETFFKAMGWNGRECVLRMLCETGQSRRESQGTFLEEIMRATFTLPEGREFESDLHKEYDRAYKHQDDCAKLYPYCENLYGTQFYDLVDSLGREGRQCVLYKLCETAQRAPAQGTFLEEFFRVVFTLPKGKEFEDEDHKEYDKAHTAGNDCQTLYPGCDNFEVPVKF